VRDGVLLTPEVSGSTEERGLAELYIRHAPDGVRLAYLLTGDRTLAEDLVQDAFARVATRLVHVRNPAAFEAYLRRSIVNLSKNHFRRRAVERAFLNRARRDVGQEAPARSDLSERDALRRALLELPERQRVAVVLRFYLDLSDAQTAEVMRCPTGTVRSLASRGVQALRAALGDKWNE
jgi:RNA polymerase sigma-70 factor (sigma-E family)